MSEPGKITVTGEFYFRYEGTKDFRVEFDAAEWAKWDEDKRDDEVAERVRKPVDLREWDEARSDYCALEDDSPLDFQHCESYVENWEESEGE
jgi:hypothetical protein